MALNFGSMVNKIILKKILMNNDMVRANWVTLLKNMIKHHMAPSHRLCKTISYKYLYKQL